MADIFLSYSSADRERARAIAQALTERDSSVWWDREIPLGKSYDEVIEQALAEAKCVIVLWSKNSVVSKWVRGEASEGEHRGILVPVFLDAVNAPLQFRFLNGADLSHWQPGLPDAEFDKLVQRVTELLDGSVSRARSPETTTSTETEQRQRIRRGGSAARLAALALAVVILTVGASAYFFRARQPQPTPPPPKENSVFDRGTGTAAGSEDLEKAVKDLAGVFGAVPATSLARGFHVPDLGVRFAFISPQQSVSSLGALPTGVVVMEVESNRPIANAGVQTGDVILTIAERKIASEAELREAIRKIGPSKTEFSVKRGSETKSVMVTCSQCKVE